MRSPASDKVKGSIPGGPLFGHLCKEAALFQGFPGGSAVQNPPANTGAVAHTRVQDPLEEERQPTPVFLPGKPHGQRSPAGHGPRGHRVGHA